MDLRSRRTIQLTNDKAIDTAPCYSPDGRQIVFETDRDGSRQIYVMDADGANPHRISHGQGSYSTPVWSPRGDLDRLHQVDGGPVPDRGDEARRLRRAGAHRGLP